MLDEICSRCSEPVNAGLCGRCAERDHTILPQLAVSAVLRLMGIARMEQKRLQAIANLPSVAAARAARRNVRRAERLQELRRDAEV